MINIRAYIGIILSFSIGVFLSSYFNGCKKNNSIMDDDNHTIVRQVIDTQYIKKDTVIYKSGSNIFHDTTIYVDVPVYIDTADVINKYYSKNIFIDTVAIDNGSIVIFDTISENMIKSRKYESSTKTMVVSEKVYIKEKAKASFFWGVGAGLGRGASETSINLFMQTPKKKMYGIGAGVINGVPVFKGNILIKL
jgi:hypothetical protein